MPSRDTIKRLEALEGCTQADSQGPRIIRLVLPHPDRVAIGTSLELAGRMLYFPGDPDEGKDVLAAMYWLAYPTGNRVVIACESVTPPPDAIIIPPCPDDIDLTEYAAQQLQRLKE